jgi:hypothetical protein
MQDAVPLHKFYGMTTAATAYTTRAPTRIASRRAELLETGRVVIVYSEIFC